MHQHYVDPHAATTAPEPQPEAALESAPKERDSAEPAASDSDATADSRVRSVEALLDDFGEDDPWDGPPRRGSPGARQLAASLKSLAKVETTAPPAVAAPWELGDPADDESGADAEQTPSPHACLTQRPAPSEARTIPALAHRPRSRRASRVTLWTSLALLVVGLVAVGAIWLERPELFAGRGSPLADEPVAPAPAAAPAAEASGACMTTLRLEGLPSPHEILLRLGIAPMHTPPLPTGVRLELVATAPECAPQRLVVPSDQPWQDVGGTRLHHVSFELAKGPMVAWPEAPLGTVGGVGPAGVIEVTTRPAGAEVWLVVGAGEQPSVEVQVPCDRPAHLVVVQPSQPSLQRRVALQPALLRTAAHGGSALPVKM